MLRTCAVRFAGQLELTLSVRSFQTPEHAVAHRRLTAELALRP